MGSAGAYAQGTSNAMPGAAIQPDDLLMTSGIDMSVVAALAEEAGIARTSMQQTQFGQVVTFDMGAGGNFFATTTGCEQGVCRGIHFFAMVDSRNVDPRSIDFNDFNSPTPLGNAGYAAETNAVGVQRAVISFNGITAGTLAFEMGVFIGYTDLFVNWWEQQTRVVAASVDADNFEALLPSKIDNALEDDNGFDATTDLGQLVLGLQEADVAIEDMFFTGKE
mgnify:CR=1 FL=1